MADEVIDYTMIGQNQVASPLSDSRQRVGATLLSNNSLLTIGLRHLLEDSGFTISGIATDKVSLSRFCPGTSCSLTIIDANNSIDQALGIIRSVKVECPHMRVVMIADHFDLSILQVGLDAGVDGFVLSGCAREVLIKSLELIMLGETILPTKLVCSVISERPRHVDQDQNNSVAEATSNDPRARKLSVREAEILRCLMGGEPNKVIARKLNVAEATVKVHIKAILRKIGVANRTQAAMWASENMPTRGQISLSA